MERAGTPATPAMSRPARRNSNAARGKCGSSCTFKRICGQIKTYRSSDNKIGARQPSRRNKQR
jgi:hypothetical protein